MRLARTTAAFVLMATLFFAASTPPAISASTVGDGFCNTPAGLDGEFCIGKNDAGSPWADWTGENTIFVFNDWRYAGFPSDSPNDDGEYAINGDSQAMLVYEDPNHTGPGSCFPTVYVSSDMKGREDNDSSLLPHIVGFC
jgi:hypothetical protein